MKNLTAIILICFFSSKIFGQQNIYAEKLGYPKNAKVLILHVDDVGMSHDSNEGAIRAIEKGVSSSMSLMMPCGWIPEIMHYLKLHPQTDAGLHLTLTSEWQNYRWGPLSGKSVTPGLVDLEGALWPSVANTLTHANAEEVDKEINAQIERSRAFGWEPTHLDTHMGTLFASPAFLEKYIAAGIKNKIPVMFPGGHNTMIADQLGAGFNKNTTDRIGQQLWNAGLPVIDDLHNVSYGWSCPSNLKDCSDDELRKYKTKMYIESISKLKPGITFVIMHCTWPSETFAKISDSGKVRKGDLLAMEDPELKKYLKDNHIIVTTWREMTERRNKL